MPGNIIAQQMSVGQECGSSLRTGFFKPLIMKLVKFLFSRGQDAGEKDGKVAALNVQFPRIAAGKKLWERHLILGDNSKDIDFYFGLHEYIGQ